MEQVCVAVVAGQGGEICDAGAGQPSHQADQFGQAAVAGAHVMRCSIGARQIDDRRVVRRKQSQDELFRHQSPPDVIDGGEAKAAVL